MLAAFFLFIALVFFTAFLAATVGRGHSWGRTVVISFVSFAVVLTTEVVGVQVWFAIDDGWSDANHVGLFGGVAIVGVLGAWLLAQYGGAPSPDLAHSTL